MKKVVHKSSSKIHKPSPSARTPNINFGRLLTSRKIGPDGGSKELLELAQSAEMIEVLENQGSAEYFKELKRKFADKGFYKSLMG